LVYEDFSSFNPNDWIFLPNYNTFGTDPCGPGGAHANDGYHNCTIVQGSYTCYGDTGSNEPCSSATGACDVKEDWENKEYPCYTVGAYKECSRSKCGYWRNTSTVPAQNKLAYSCWCDRVLDDFKCELGLKFALLNRDLPSDIIVEADISPSDGIFKYAGLVYGYNSADNTNYALFQDGSHIFLYYLLGNGINGGGYTNINPIDLGSYTNIKTYHYKIVANGSNITGYINGGYTNTTNYTRSGKIGFINYGSDCSNYYFDNLKAWRIMSSPPKVNISSCIGVCPTST